MDRALTCAAAALFGLCITGMFPQARALEQAAEDVRIGEVAQSVLQAVVKVTARKRSRVNSIGAGSIIDELGIVLVPNHLIDVSDDIRVTLQGGGELAAEVIGRDAKTDLALLKIKVDRSFKTITLGDSDKLTIGARVVTVGYPAGLGSTVTAARVTALHQDIAAGPYDDFIQTDVAYRGMGPVFNLQGQMVGISNAFLEPPGATIKLGFAMPSNQAKPIIKDLRELGRVRRGWSGVRI